MFVCNSNVLLAGPGGILSPVDTGYGSGVTSSADHPGLATMNELHDDGNCFKLELLHS